MNILVCGDRGWSAPNIIRDTIAIYNRDNDTIYYELESGAATYGMAIGRELEFQTEIYRGKDDIANIHLVLAFHNFIRNSKRTWFIIKEARALGIPYRVINSKGEVTMMSNEQS